MQWAYWEVQCRSKTFEERDWTEEETEQRGNYNRGLSRSLWGARELGKLTELS